jgi:WD40 repeat protein
VNGSLFAPDGQRAVVLAAADKSSSGKSASLRPMRGEMESQRGQLIFWNWRTGQETSPRMETPSEPIGAAWSPDAKSIAVICAAGQVLLIDAAKGERRAEADHGAHFTPGFVTRGHVRFAPDGKSFVTWSNESIRAWDSATAERQYGVDLSSTADTVYAHDVQFSPDGRRLAIAGSDQLLRVIDHVTGQPATDPLPHPDWVFTACFSPDGERILTACRDGMARQWDWRTGKLVCPALAHKDEVFGATITPNGRWLLTASRDSTVRIWDAANGKPITPPLAMPAWMYDVRVTPDGNFALASGVSDSLYVFDLREFVEPDAHPLNVASLKTLGEIISGQTIHEGGVVNLTTREWLDRWQRFRRDHPDFHRYDAAGDSRVQPK